MAADVGLKAAESRGAESSVPRIARLLGRLVLGGVFIRLGIAKLADPIAFLKAIREYGLVSDDRHVVLNTIAAILPWAEILLGALIVLGVARRGVALVMLLMLVPFTLAIWTRASEIQGQAAIPFCDVAFDCGCGTGVVAACRKLAENCGLIVLAAWLTAARASALAWRESIRRCEES